VVRRPPSFLTALLTLGCFLAASGASALPVDGDGSPIAIDSDNAVEWHQNEKAYVARGNASATRGDSRVEADVLTAYYREAERDANGKAPAAKTESGDAGSGASIHQIVAEGNVRILDPGRTVFGDRAVYDADKKILVVTGSNLRLVTQSEVVTARDALEYLEDRGLAVARGDAAAARGGDRMRADTLVGTFAKGPDGRTSLTRIDGSGSVVVTTKSDVATSEKMIYAAKEDVAVLIGNVKITRGDDHVAGERAEMNFKTKVNRVVAGDRSGTSGRVRALLVPAKSADKTAVGETPAPASR